MEVMISRKEKFVQFWKKWWLVIWYALVGTYIICFGIYSILHFHYHVDYLEYANVDFEWDDDFECYGVLIVYEDKPHYLTVKDNKVKFIYADEDFLNFVVVDYCKRVYDGESRYSIDKFYINLNYKEVCYETNEENKIA